MPGPFPCNNPPSLCETSPNPLTSFSSEAQDSTTFIGLAWAGQLPALNTPFTVYPCEAITDSQVSQSDADIKAANLAVACANPCAPIFFNTAQTATGTCPNGTTYFITIPAGIFTADNQVLADRKAFTAAVAALRGHSVCLGSLAPASICRGEFYFGIIGVTSTDTPVSLVLLSGELPDGLVLVTESDRAVIQGTPLSFGTAHFILQATSAAGVVTQQSYSLAVTGIVTDSALPDGSSGTPYSAQLTAIVPDGAVTIWSVADGSLPDGLTLDADTGEITGTPTTGGDSSFTVNVTAAGSTCAKDFTLTVTSVPTFSIVILPDDFAPIGPGAVIGGPFSGTVYVYGNGDVFNTTDGGITWTELFSNLSGLDFGINCFGFGAGLFVVGMGGGQIATSPDAVMWTAQTSPTGNGLNEVALGAGVLVMVGVFGTIINSTDGINWNDVSVADSTFTSVIFGGGQFVAVGWDGIIYTSPDGTTWTPQVSGTAVRLLGVAYSGSQFVVVGRGGTILTSPDGVAWTPQVSPVADDLVAVGFGEGTFMLATDPGAAGDLYESVDGGVTWTQNLSRTIDANEKYTHVRFDINFIFTTTFRSS